MRDLAIATLFLSLANMSIAHARESGADKANESIVPKIVASCGIALRVRYDLDSLSKLNLDIQRDQTDGAPQCDAPLRFMWHACKTAPGKNAVKKSGITNVVCKGTSDKKGDISVSGGTLTVKRAYEESKAEARAQQQLRKAFNFNLVYKEPDPYYDQEWSDLPSKANPVNDLTNYCLLDNDKVTLDDNRLSNGIRDAQFKTARCWKNNKLIHDLKKEDRKITGRETEESHDGSYSVIEFLDGEQHGDTKYYDKAGKLYKLMAYRKGKEARTEHYDEKGNLKEYVVYLESGKFGKLVLEKGKVSEIECAPGLQSDNVLSNLCGFQGAKTVELVGDSDKVQSKVVFKDGIIQSQSGGRGNLELVSNVAFKNGKKHGLEKLSTHKGVLSQEVTWDQGRKHGVEKQYYEDGKRVIATWNWSNDVLKESREYYLNGKLQVEVKHLGDGRNLEKNYYDTGKLRFEGGYASCVIYYWTFSCRDGLHKWFYRNGQLSDETQFDHGKRSGVEKYYSEKGLLSWSAVYAKGIRKSLKTFDEKGKQILSEEYHEDGSVK